MEFTAEQREYLRKTGQWFVEGASDKEIEAKRAKALYDADMFTDNKNRVELAKVADSGSPSYTLKSLALVANKDKYSGKNGDKDFLNDFFGGEKDKNARDRWKDKIEDAYGEGAWENAKKVLQAAEIDKMNKTIRENREQYMEGNAPDQDAVDWIESAIMGVFQPRQKKAYKEGRNPTASEVFMDSFQNAAYALPFTRAGAPIARALGNGTAGKILGSVASNAMAPAAVVAGDAALGTKDYSGVADALIDLGLGTATNLGVNKGLGMVLGRGVGLLQGKARSPRLQYIADMLEGTPSQRDKASELVKEATNRAKNTLNSKVPLDEAAQAQLMDDLAVAELGRVAKDKTVRADYSKTIKEGRAWQSEPTSRVGNLVGKEPLWKTDLYTAIHNRPSAEQILEAKVSGRSASTGKVTPKPDDNLFTLADEIPDEKYFVREALRKHPELEELFVDPSVKEQLGRTSSEMLKNFSVNNWGSDTDASRILNLVPGLGDVKGVRKKYQEEPRKKARAAKAKDILDLSGLTGEDAKFMQAIRETAGTDRDVLKGFGIGNTAEFRNWYLLRGADLLRGSELYRPTFEVE